MEKVTVTAKYLYQLLSALNGPAHHIRELQATRNIDQLTPDPEHRNPINVLVDEYNAAVDANAGAPKEHTAEEVQKRIHVLRAELCELQYREKFPHVENIGEVMADVLSLKANGQRAEAIRILRMRTGIGLKEAVDFFVTLS